ncbi:unnamed protein product [Cercopithifilaria johnstoni]|uniref:Uncharacterized protein n=1 Tax=Cercopithifilaria johnstoni TaxID=2874296 RepID=A0A8J2LTQ9_9BILA|nr:unnamed protein product [Cercopithifilaria johnstoni]
MAFSTALFIMFILMCGSGSYGDSSTSITSKENKTTAGKVEKVTTAKAEIAGSTIGTTAKVEATAKMETEAKVEAKKTEEELPVEQIMITAIRDEDADAEDTMTEASVESIGSMPQMS